MHCVAGSSIMTRPCHYEYAAFRFVLYRRRLPSLECSAATTPDAFTSFQPTRRRAASALKAGAEDIDAFDEQVCRGRTAGLHHRVYRCRSATHGLPLISCAIFRLTIEFI